MKLGKISLAAAVLLSATFFGLAKLANGAVTGRLDMEVNINNLSYVNNTYKFLHKDTTTDGFDSGEDNVYGTIFSPFPIASKAISRIPGYELMTDKRHPDSNTPIDLELSIHSESGDPISVNSSNNYLEFTIDPTSQGWNFGNKPITYWEPNDADPNIYHLVANVRKEILQNSGVVPIPILDGTYESEEPYLYAGIRYDVYDTDLYEDEDNITNFRDYAVFANNWKRKGITDSNRGNVDDPGAWADFNLDGDVDYSDLDFMNDVWVYKHERTVWK